MSTASPPPSSRPLAQRARGISGLTLLSRILGIARETVFARLFGGGLHADALVVAFRIPNLLRDLFAEGALSAALVPALGRARVAGGDPGVAALARAILARLFAVVGVLTLIGIIAAPFLVDTIAGGFADGPDGAVKRAETIRLTRLLFPFLLVISLAAVARSVLHLRGRFLLPTLGPPAANLLAITVGIGLIAAGASSASAATAWALALLGGGILTLAIQVPALLRSGVSPLPRFGARHPELAAILRQMGYAAIGLAAVQVNIFVGTTLASGLEPGSVAALNYGFRLIYLPIGMIGVAIATVATVDLSHKIAAGDLSGAGRDLAGGLRLTAFLSIPSAVGLWVLAEPVVRLIYEYGKFTTDDTARAALAVRGYGIGLLFYSLSKVQVPACTAIGRVRVPALAALISTVGFVGCALATYRSHGVLAIALATSLAACLNSIVLAIALRDRLRTDGAVGRGLLGSVLLAAVMGVACSFAIPLLDGWWGHAGFLPRLATVGGTTLLGAGIVLGGGALLRLPEAEETLRALPGVRRQRRSRSSVDDPREGGSTDEDRDRS